MMTRLICCIIFSSFAKQPFPGSDEIVEDSRCLNDLEKRTKLADKHTHLRCEQLIERKFPQCARANLETICLLKIGDFLGNYGCVSVASLYGVPSPLGRVATVIGAILFLLLI
jgi:hypothetical protein